MSDSTDTTGGAGDAGDRERERGRDIDGDSGVVARTRFAVTVALGRRDSRLVFASVTAVYTLGYLYALRDLFPGGTRTAMRVVRDPVGRFFQPAPGPFNFEPVALVETELFTFLFSLNTPLGVGLGALVGVNAALTYLAWRQPAACGFGTASAGLLAGVPALLSGSACCGPLLLIGLGIQASGTLLTAFDVLLPVAVALLVGSLFLVGRQVDPARVRGGDSVS
jgi:hypothetical protein